MAASEISVIPLEATHVDIVIENCRDTDRAEIYRMALLDPGRAIRATVANAEYAYAGFYQGRLACIFGVNRKNWLSDVGVPWLIGTPVIDEIPVSFLRHSARFYKRLVAEFPELENWVWSENIKAVQWLRWLGFDMDDAAPFGATGSTFIRFTKGLRDVH